MNGPYSTTSWICARGVCGRHRMMGGCSGTSHLMAQGSSWSEYILPQVLAPGAKAQVLSVYLAIPGKIAFVETQGRENLYENLYDMLLADGSMLRSIQPVRGDIAVGNAVAWRASGAKVMVFGEDGARP